MTFDLFWQDQLRKEAKIDAMKAWRTALKFATESEIMEGWQRSKPHYAARERQFIPLPATWLRSGRMFDEYDTPEHERQVYVPNCRHCKEPLTGATTDGMHPACYDDPARLRVV